MDFVGSFETSCCSGTSLCSAIPKDAVWINEPCVLGVDEAGRGPVLGPMVYAVAAAPASVDLVSKRFADSKTLTAEKRDELLKAILEDPNMAFAAETLSAQFISEEMLSTRKVSLNEIAYNSTCKLIQHVLDRGIRVTQVFIDTVGDAERYQQRMTRTFPCLEFTVCPKADSLYPIVSAASIVAKVTRDQQLELTAKALGIEGSLGTGYPSDPATKAWLAANVSKVFGFPPLARFSWETVTRLLQEQGVVCEWESEGDDGAAAGQQTRLCWGAPATSTANLVETSALNRHSFFRARKLQRCTEVL